MSEIGRCRGCIHYKQKLGLCRKPRMVLGDPASAAMLTANIREREHLKGLKWDPDNADMWFAFRGELAVRPDFGCVEFEGAIAVPDKPGVFVADSSSSIFLKAPEVKP